jgi:hypothetical protein
VPTGISARIFCNGNHHVSKPLHEQRVVTDSGCALSVVQLRPGFWSTLWLALVGLAATLGGSGLALVFAALWLFSVSSGGSRPSRPDAEPPGTPPLSTESSADGLSGAVKQATREQPIGPWQLETGRLHRLHIAVCLMLSSVPYAQFRRACMLLQLCTALPRPLTAAVA